KRIWLCRSLASPLKVLCYSLRKQACDGALALLGPILDRLAGDQENPVVVAAEGGGTGADIIGQDPVTALFVELRAAVLDDMLGLRGKADDQRRSVFGQTTDCCQNVRVFNEWQVGKAAVLLLDFLLGLG